MHSNTTQDLKQGSAKHGRVNGKYVDEYTENVKRHRLLDLICRSVELIEPM